MYDFSIRVRLTLNCTGWIRDKQFLFLIIIFSVASNVVWIPQPFHDTAYVGTYLIIKHGFPLWSNLKLKNPYDDSWKKTESSFMRLLSNSLMGWVLMKTDRLLDQSNCSLKIVANSYVCRFLCICSNFFTRIIGVYNDPIFVGHHNNK